MRMHWGSWSPPPLSASSGLPGAFVVSVCGQPRRAPWGEEAVAGVGGSGRLPLRSPQSVTEPSPLHCHGLETSPLPQRHVSPSRSSAGAAGGGGGQGRGGVAHTPSVTGGSESRGSSAGWSADFRRD